MFILKKDRVTPLSLDIKSPSGRIYIYRSISSIYNRMWRAANVFFKELYAFF
jgi:hypothetical protein